MPLPKSNPRSYQLSTTSANEVATSGLGDPGPAHFPPFSGDMDIKRLPLPPPLPPETTPTKEEEEEEGSARSDGPSGTTRRRKKKRCEALSISVSDLKKKCVFVAVVVKDHQWTSSDRTEGDFSVKVCR